MPRSVFDAEPEPLGPLLNFKPFKWMRAALEERAAKLTAAIRAEAEKRGAPTPPPVSLSAALRDVLAEVLRGNSGSAARAAGFAEGWVAAYATYMKMQAETSKQVLARMHETTR